MRLVSKSPYSVFRFEVNMEKIISSIYHLIVELSGKKDSNVEFNGWVSDVFGIDGILGRSDRLDTITEDTFLIDIASVLEKGLYDKPDYLNKTNICFVYTDQKIAIIQGNHKDAQKTIVSWIDDYKPVERLFDLIVDKRLAGYKNAILPLINKINYQQAVHILSCDKWDSTLISDNWLDKIDMNESPVDNSSVWIGGKLSNALGNISNLKELVDNSGNLVGIVLDDTVLPLVNVDKHIINEFKTEYFYKMLKGVYSPGNAMGNVAPKSSLTPFIDVCRDAEFCNLMSHLKYNLYINDVEIPEKYRHLFEEVYHIEKIGKLPNYSFYTGIRQEFGKTILGVYEHEKVDSEYNLLHWVNEKSENQYEIIHCNKNEVVDSTKVFALLPQYSYYFISKFYEQSFAGILEEIGCEFLSNICLAKQDVNDFIEIDAIVLNKKDKSLIYVENKTTLNKLNLEDTIHKIEVFHDFMQKEGYDVKINYVIAAPYCDESLNDGFVYFIKNGGKSENRTGVKHCVYDFQIPLAKYENVTLRCIVEPEYDKMKTIITSLVQ